MPDMSLWNRILQWCAENAPATRAAVLTPLDEDALNTAQRRTGGWNWPEEVLAFFEQCNGLERTPAGYILPGYRPMTLDEVVSWWERLLLDARGGKLPEFSSEKECYTYFAQMANDPTPGSRNLNADRAGSPAGQFISAWLPIAEDQDGNFLVVDRRRGPKAGCLTEIDKVDVDFEESHWPSLTALLDAVATSLDTGAPVAGSRYMPVASRDRLAWKLVRSASN